MTEFESACERDDAHCITCGDEGTAVRVLDAGEETVRCVDQDGVVHAIAVDLVGSVRPGDRLLAHAGVALTRLEGV